MGERTAAPKLPSVDPQDCAPHACVDDRIEVAIAIIRRGDAVLICRRPAGGSFAGYWEFPGGKREPGESLAHCVAREVREELAMTVQPCHALTPIEHDYPSRRIRLHPFVCNHAGDEPELIACDAARWVRPQDLHAYQFPPANEPLLRETIAYLTAPAVDFDQQSA